MPCGRCAVYIRLGPVRKYLSNVYMRTLIRAVVLRQKSIRPLSLLILARLAGHDHGVLATILWIARALALACRGHHELVLENLALRQQLQALTRTRTRPVLRGRDRLFWIVLATTWRHWRAALVFVQPDTVVRWHREWLRRRWTRRSAHRRAGRPSTAATIRHLVGQMAAVNPLWGAPRIHGELTKVGWRYRSTPSHGSCGGRADHRHRRGARF